VSALIGTGAPQYVYGYDHASNLLSITPNAATQSFAYTSTNSITSGTYDANGSPSVLSGKSYKWDGANRMVHFANTANNTGSTFVYDGLGRLVRVVDTHAGAITADHSYTWCGTTRCLAHDNTQSGSPVSTQYFDQGAIIGGTAYYYVKDQLGSVTHLVTNTGSVASQYSYDPYGNRTTVSGTVASDIGYAGYFNHGVSGLEFALHRAYDPTHARWLNRDPVGEMGGTNLYAYVGGNPVSYTDSSGLCPDEDKCQELLDKMNSLIDSVRPGDNPSAYKGLAQRYKQLPNLQKYAPEQLPGHLIAYNNDRKNLQSVIDDYIDSGCGNPPPLAVEWANKTYVAPAPLLDELDPNSNQYYANVQPPSITTTAVVAFLQGILAALTRLPVVP
jgi:RHS repeat-associated protein